MSDSSAIDQALVDLLLNDATLRALLPDGVFWEEAGASMVAGGNATRFVIVSLVDAVDESMFGGRAYEDVLYAVKAVELAASVKHIRAAAARIDALLDPQPPAAPATLAIAGYGLMVLQREARIRFSEVDDTDTSIRWSHRGGHYRLMAAPT
jgi:hypothetical protein